MRFILILTVLLINLLDFQLNAQDWNDIKKYIVSITCRSVVAPYLGASSTLGTVYGTGFIGNVKEGIVVTNNHVVNKDYVVAKCTVTTYDGREVNAEFLYADPWLDFAFLKIDPKLLNLKKDIKFSSENNKIGAPVTIIGKNENKQFSTQTGTIASIYSNAGCMPQQAIRVSLNAQGGASGSPLLNTETKEVIGLVFGSNYVTSAFAIPIKFILDAISFVVKGEKPPRYHSGVIVDYIRLDDLVKYYNFPQKHAEDYLKKFPDSFNNALLIKGFVPSSPAENCGLKIGDMIYKINDEEIGPDFYIFEHHMNKAGGLGENVKITVVRNGNFIDVNVSLYNLNDRKIKKIICLGGGIFFEADDFISWVTGVKPGTVVMNNTKSGSSFLEKMPFSANNSGASLNTVLSVLEINNTAIKCLDDLLKIAAVLLQKKDFSIVFKNHGFNQIYNNNLSFNQAEQVTEISLSNFDEPPVFYEKKQENWTINLIPTTLEKNLD